MFGTPMVWHAHGEIIIEAGLKFRKRVVRGKNFNTHVWRLRKYLLIALLVFASASASAADRSRFWNLTSVTITKLYLAPAGTTNWSPDQCQNDKDGSVDADERLQLKNIAPGTYDVKLTDKHGRICYAKNVQVKSGGSYSFSLNDKDLTDCSQ